MGTSATEPAELEVQITIRNKTTGTAEERTYFRTQGVTVYQDTEDGQMDIVLSFTALGDESHGRNILMVKDLGIVPPCTCYEKLTGK